jgi:hypothetical protein
MAKSAKNIKILKKKDRLATLVHLADGIVHNAKHSNAHVQSLKKNGNKKSTAFNNDHAAKHAKEILDHAEKLKDHMRKWKSLADLERELDGKSF